ncbi:lysylphosphatidylglycerol synthase domain-containing protein [Paludisphaera mucosa]|uniref:Lysylphosphatidylglycerol synthase domain-containing protein n=1 Tax=Paludisphaera mucosa TaxID=3030827 RepID=A0ABT6FE52_9BACT|nr:lysylphosphatidylglycerol synthase domain-containing protein [Paludisphaera mucosa]MDG3005858.1 lysylphosphatidylglycerol synthase domain-containing protein [Paludisphaera mucosa]
MAFVSHLRVTSRIRRWVLPTLGVLIAAAMLQSLAGHGASLLRSGSQISLSSLILALGLSVVHRIVNAGGWGLMVRSLGQRIGTSAGVRVWLASEACRWLPGSVWSYGSRTFLASRLGLKTGTVAASLVLEILVTIVGWAVVAGLGWGYLASSLTMLGRHLPRLASGWFAVGGLAALLLAASTAVLASNSPRFLARFSRFKAQLLALRELRVGVLGLAKGVAFFAIMGIFNGLVFAMVVHAAPGGANVPVGAAIAGNAAAWLVGFFAIFAPGGLVVREACLTTLLSPWMPAEQALVASLAWRLIQIVAEVLCFALMAAWGLPKTLGGEPGRREARVGSLSWSNGAKVQR